MKQLKNQDLSGIEPWASKHHVCEALNAFKDKRFFKNQI